MSPVSLPSPQTPNPSNRRILRGGLLLSVMLAIPVIGVFVMQESLMWSCTTQTLATGIADGKIEWRITSMKCKGASAPFYDVAIGAEDKTLVTALTTIGAPAPIDVTRLDEGRIGVRLENAPGYPRSGEIIPVRLRRSGTPAERIDLQGTASPIRR